MPSEELQALREELAELREQLSRLAMAVHWQNTHRTQFDCPTAPSYPYPWWQWQPTNICSASTHTDAHNAQNGV